MRVRLAPTSLLALLPLFACAAPAAGRASYDDASRRRLTMLLGERMLDGDAFRPVEDQGFVGLELSYGGAPEGLGFELGVTSSEDDEDGVVFPGLGTFDVESSVLEFYGGVRREFGDQAVRPFVAGGVSIARAEVEVGTADGDDTSLGAYVHGGVLFQLSSAFAVTADARYRFGEDNEIAGAEGDSDFLAVALGLALSL